MRHNPAYWQNSEDKLWDVKCSCGWSSLRNQSEAEARSEFQLHLMKRRKK